MNRNDISICVEREDMHREVENLVRDSFWNIYRPGCLEHYVLHCLRNDPDFMPELDFVMKKGCEIIGQNIFVRAEIKADDGRIIPIMTMGQICIAPELKRQGYGKLLLDYSLKKAAARFVLREILTSTEKAALNMPGTSVSAITDCQRARMHHSSSAKS